MQPLHRFQWCFHQELQLLVATVGQDSATCGRWPWGRTAVLPLLISFSERSFRRIFTFQEVADTLVRRPSGPQVSVALLQMLLKVALVIPDPVVLTLLRVWARKPLFARLYAKRQSVPLYRKRHTACVIARLAPGELSPARLNRITSGDCHGDPGFVDLPVWWWWRTSNLMGTSASETQMQRTVENECDELAAKGRSKIALVLPREGNTPRCLQVS